MNIYAHRGLFDNKKIVENTIPAFKKALKEDLNIELDIRLTKDKKIIVFHDDNLKRLTGIDKLVKDTTYDELKKVKLLDTDLTIPTLEEVLNLVSGKCILLIEIKELFSISSLAKLNKLLLDYNGKVLLQSFNPFVIKRISLSSLGRYSTGILLTNKYKGIKEGVYNLYIYNYLLKRKYCDFISSPMELVFKVKEKSDKELFIDSTVIFSNSAILLISASLVCSFILPGTSPICEAVPFVAKYSPFLSNILPLSASIVLTLTLSLLFKLGNIKLDDQFILYSLLSSNDNVIEFANSMWPAIVSIELL